MRQRASCCRWLARKSWVHFDASPRDMASGSPGHASRPILQSRRASSPVAPLLGEDGEVAMGEVSVDALVDAAELVGTLHDRNPPPAGFGLGRLSRLAVQERLAEIQLVVDVEPEALGTRVQSRPKVSERLVATGDQGEEFPRGGIGGGRSAQAALDMAQRGRGGLTAIPLCFPLASLPNHSREPLRSQRLVPYSGNLRGFWG